MSVMPRPNETPRWRRVAMQGIMWVILAATVGVAALVNHEVRRTHGGELAQPVRVSDDLSIRLPLGWRVIDESDGYIEVQEGKDDAGRTLSVRIGTGGSLFESFWALGGGEESRPVKAMDIPVGDQTGRLIVRKKSLARIDLRLRGYYEIDTSVTAPIQPGNRKLTITLSEVGRGQKSQIEGNIDLVKRIAGSVQAGAAPGP